ncbi:transcriptional regulator, TetR family [Leptospira ryugenii]|uniref:Transcriptional regulator, TetR family n=1 Tax=Leptospira ryugenii TaxID=1917863 RepID=A0A2P2E351_9LEPT|nr:TetR/AcrR family transcriptional regulator [Leptospira ryugenii]GBF51246.1 transcriptional regulator, TetR family [Leptospira ryugenii]
MKRKESQQLTVSRILESAEKNFADYGFHAASVETITMEAGYSRGAFYSNFESKEDLFLKLVESRMDQILMELDLILTTELPPNQKLDHIRTYYRKNAQNPKFALIMSEFFQLAIRSHEIKEKIRKINRVYNQKLASIVDHIFNDSKEKPALSSYEITVMLLSLGEGLMLQHLSDPKKFNDAAISKTIDFAFDRLIQIHFS